MTDLSAARTASAGWADAEARKISEWGQGEIQRILAQTEAYEKELGLHAGAPAVEGAPAPTSDDSGPAGPRFDVVLLGMGPDGHIASLFPGHPSLDVTDRTVVGVHGSPKPPPERVSLTVPALEAAEEVWFVVAGADKAEATARALAGDDPHRTPAAAALGRRRTLWLVDVAAAG